MYCSADDAASIYARACRAWYGKRARRVIEQQVQRLQRRGDERGVHAWSLVSKKLSETKTRRAKPGKLY